jgi:hypothetical protein
MKRYYVKEIKSGKIHSFGPDLNKAIKFQQTYTKLHGYFSSDFGTSQDGFEQVNKIKVGLNHAKCQACLDDLSCILNPNEGFKTQSARLLKGFCSFYCERITSGGK